MGRSPPAAATVSSVECFVLSLPCLQPTAYSLQPAFFRPASSPESASLNPHRSRRTGPCTFENQHESPCPAPSSFRALCALYRAHPSLFDVATYLLGVRTHTYVFAPSAQRDAWAKAHPTHTLHPGRSEHQRHGTTPLPVRRPHTRRPLPFDVATYLLAYVIIRSGLWPRRVLSAECLVLSRFSLRPAPWGGQRSLRKEAGERPKTFLKAREKWNGSAKPSSKATCLMSVSFRWRARAAWAILSWVRY